MDERAFFAVSAAVGLMQSIEAAILLSRGGRISPLMYVSSAVEAAWLGMSVWALWHDWVAGSRRLWPWAFIVYFVCYAIVASKAMAGDTEQEPDARSTAIRDLVIPRWCALASLCFTVAYGIGSLLTYRAL